MSRVTGCVKWFNNRKGFGFICSNGMDIFVHHSEIQTPSTQGYKYLVQGEYVEFTIAAVKKRTSTGTMACDVTGIGRGHLMCETRAINAPVFNPDGADAENDSEPI